MPPHKVKALVLLAATLLPAEAFSASHRTEHFVVEAPSVEVAKKVAEVAEEERKAQAKRWLGKELPAWKEPCPIRVTIKTGEPSGATSFSFDGGKLLWQRVEVEGSLERLLISIVPHEVTHSVLGSHFREPIPRWADEGVAILSEDEGERGRHDKIVRECVKNRRAIPLSRLFGIKEYPNDALGFYSQSYSVTRFLVERKDHATFLAFIKLGMRDGWDRAATVQYKFADVADLEKAWLESLKQIKERE